MKYFVFILMIIFILTNENLLTESKTSSNVKVELISSSKEISEGEEFWILVQFTIKNKWHIYWENPGDAGMATKLEFNLPMGFEAGKVLYQYPEKFKTEGLTSYGYKNKAILLTKIKAPKTLSKEKNYRIIIKIDWLECRDICIPGTDELELTLKPANHQKTKYNNPFKNHFFKIPQSLVDLDSKAEIFNEFARISLKFPDFIDTKTLNFQIYPLNEAIFVHSQKPIIKKESNRYSIELRFDPFKVEIPNKLEFVLVLDDKNAKILNSKSIYFFVDLKKK